LEVVVVRESAAAEPVYPAGFLSGREVDRYLMLVLPDADVALLLQLVAEASVAPRAEQAQMFYLCLVPLYKAVEVAVSCTVVGRHNLVHKKNVYYNIGFFGVKYLHGVKKKCIF
jgi:hypothetical protein